MKPFVCFILLLGGCASVPTAFEAYSVPLSRIEKIAQTKIPRSGLNWKMEGYLQSSSQVGAPDFADRFTLFLISCGTGCTEYAVLDRVSGEFHPGEMVTLDYPPDYLGPYGFQFRRDSRLLVVHHAEGFQWPVFTSYYLWDGTRMRLLKKEAKRPNKAPEPTSGIVTSRAEPRAAPIPPVAHL